jgi:hypothetical protein
MHHLLNILCGAGIALILIAGGAHAATQHYPDSQPVTCDCFSAAAKPMSTFPQVVQSRCPAFSALVRR